MGTAKSVPFFNYQQAFTMHEEAYTRIFRDVMHRGAFIMQKDLEELEHAIATYVGVRHGIGVGNATDALEIILQAKGIGPGDEVIFPSHTMVATPGAVVAVGATPVPVDCGPDHLMEPAALEPVITERTKAICPVQLNGRTCRMDAIAEVADKHGLIIVEDSAQALGSKYKGRMAGSFGAGGMFSFYPAKILGCMGDGGMIVTDDDDVAHLAFSLRDHGRGETTDAERWGRNSRLDNLQAAFLLWQFQDYQGIIDRRRAMATMYDERLRDVSELVLPPPPDSDPEHYDVFQNYEIEAERRDELQAFLGANGVGTLIQWGGKPVHQFAALGLDVSLPNTDRLFERCIMLPMNLTLTDDDVEYVAATVRRFYGA
jgi:dTDP-4-amino-4,6-dideoxygalactose transaminase